MSEELEEPTYELLRKYRGFEVRKYADTIQARVSSSGMNYGESARPFRRIAGYIFGGNEKQQSIAMTAPVHIWQSGKESLMAYCNHTPDIEWTLIPLDNSIEEAQLCDVL